MEYRSVDELWTAFLRAEPRPRVVERLHARLAHEPAPGADGEGGDDRVGGDGREGGRPARVADEHRPDGPHDDASCTTCRDEPWPCPAIADILRP